MNNSSDCPLYFRHISGISESEMYAPLIGHEFSLSFRKVGRHYNTESSISYELMPRDNKSAGFLDDETCCQSKSEVNRCISPTQFAIKTDISRT